MRGTRNDKRHPDSASVAGEQHTGSHIELTHVEKRFGRNSTGTMALEAIDLEIARREFVVLLGPSGCGKTTLLKIVGGLAAPTVGNVLVGGAPLWQRNVLRRDTLGELGMVFQDPNLFPWFKIDENIALPLRLKGWKKRDRLTVARKLCTLVGIEGFEHSHPRELSGGMRQRAAIARALSYEPKILLMDEPFGALDALTRDQMNLEIQRLWMQTGSTVLFVTHSITEAVLLADRIVLLSPRPGRVDSIVDVPFSRPRSLDLASESDFQDIVRQLRHWLEAL